MPIQQRRLTSLPFFPSCAFSKSVLTLLDSHRFSSCLRACLPNCLLFPTSELLSHRRLQHSAYNAWILSFNSIIKHIVTCMTVKIRLNVSSYTYVHGDMEGVGLSPDIIRLQAKATWHQACHLTSSPVFIGPHFSDRLQARRFLSLYLCRQHNVWYVWRHVDWLLVRDMTDPGTCYIVLRVGEAGSLLLLSNSLSNLCTQTAWWHHSSAKVANIYSTVDRIRGYCWNVHTKMIALWRFKDLTVTLNI